jgi:isoleucyl-tRNA synthetase
MYLEGSDQHRGWFNSSLSTAVVVKGQAPYKQVLTHGFVLDEEKEKMSKSLGNTIDPLKITNELGADILRLWVASADYRNDVSVSNSIIKQTTEAYRKIRNTCRFILSNLSDFEEKDQVLYQEMNDLEKWILIRMEKLLQRAKRAYENYEFHVVFHAVHNFCVFDLSNIYFDIRKDTLYCSLPFSQERRAAQTVLSELIRSLSIMLSPVLTYTMEEVWNHLRKKDEPVSVQLLDWPGVNEERLDDELERRINDVLRVREVVTKVLEEARAKKIIGHSLGAHVDIYADDEWLAALNKFEDLKRIFIVSQIELHPLGEKNAEAGSLEEVPGVWASARAAQGDKCERCWTVDLTVGKDEEHASLCERCAQVLRQL